MRCRALLAALPAALSLSSPAAACSMVSTYRIPTTLELVDRAEVIVLARVADGGPSTEHPFKTARLVPFTLLKGSTMPAEVRLEAVLSEKGVETTASDPSNLVDAHPDTFNGACRREVFDEGMILVVFLHREGGALVPDLSAFSRSLEDVPSPDALWVKAVKLYVAIAATPPSRRRQDMEHRRELLAADTEDPDARLLALELDRALRTGK